MSVRDREIDNVCKMIVEFPNKDGIPEGLRGCPAFVEYRGPTEIYLDGELLRGEALRYAKDQIGQRVDLERNGLQRLFDTGDIPSSLEIMSPIRVQYNQTSDGVFVREDDGTIRMFKDREEYFDYLGNLSKRGKVESTTDRTLTFREYRDQQLLPDIFAGSDSEEVRDHRIKRAVETGILPDGW